MQHAIESHMLLKAMEKKMRVPHAINRELNNWQHSIPKKKKEKHFNERMTLNLKVALDNLG